MNIAIDGRGVNWYRGTGIGTYTQNLIKYLLKNDSKNFYNIYWAGDNYESIKKKNTKIIMTSKKHRSFFEYDYFNYYNNKKNIDIFHTTNNGIDLDIKMKCKKIVTIHDVIPYVMPETVGKRYLNKFLKQMPYIIENSDAIITVSEFSKKDILRFFPVDPDKIFVTHLAANERYKPLIKERCRSLIKRIYKIDKPFILYVGGFSDRKNVKSLISAYNKAYKNFTQDCYLVILGSYKAEGKPLLKYCQQLGIEDKVIFTGFVEEKYLTVFYNACEVFVYPSFYEGFGLPPLEAMKCGTPVIASNATSIPEVVIDAGIIIDPFSIDDISEAVVKVVNDLNLKKSLANKALIKSREFSWENTAEETLKIYNEVLYKTFAK